MHLMFLVREYRRSVRQTSRGRPSAFASWFPRKRRTMVLDLSAMVRPPDRTLLGYLASYDAHLSRLALALREVVLEEAPGAIESICKGYAVTIAFSFTGRPLKDGFCHIVTYTNHVNLGFNRGALLPDPNRLLAGTGKSIRHMTIRNQDDLNRPTVRRYLQTAIDLVGTPRAPEAKRKLSPVPRRRSLP